MSASDYYGGVGRVTTLFDSFLTALKIKHDHEKAR